MLKFFPRFLSFIFLVNIMMSPLTAECPRKRGKCKLVATNDIYEKIGDELRYTQVCVYSC